METDTTGSTTPTRLLDPDPAPEGAREAAAELAEGLLGPDFELATVHIPVHRMRLGPDGTAWDPSVPLVAWAFPAFRDGGLACLAVVGPGMAEARPAGPDTELGEALGLAAGVARAASRPPLLRLVETPGAADAFWVDWGRDTFVALRPPRVLSGPAFAALARTAAEGEFADLVRAAEAEPDGGDPR